MKNFNLGTDFITIGDFQNESESPIDVATVRISGGVFYSFHFLVLDFCTFALLEEKILFAPFLGFKNLYL